MLLILKIVYGSQITLNLFIPLSGVNNRPQRVSPSGRAITKPFRYQVVIHLIRGLSMAKKRIRPDNESRKRPGLITGPKFIQTLLFD